MEDQTKTIQTVNQIAAHAIGQLQNELDTIEQELLRGEFDEGN